MESNRGLVPMPSLAKKSMTFLRDAYNLASHQKSSSNTGVHNLQSFQPSQGLSHHFGQTSTSQQYLRPSSNTPNNSWSGPQNHSTPNLGSHATPPVGSPVSPSLKPSNQWPPLATQPMPPPPPYNTTNANVSRPSSVNDSHHSPPALPPRNPVAVQVFSPDDYHEIYQSESAHHVPKPPRRASSAMSSASQQHHQVPPSPGPHQQQQQYQATSPPIAHYSTFSPTIQQYQTQSPPIQQQQVYSPLHQQYPFPPQHQPHIVAPEAQQPFQQAPPYHFTSQPVQYPQQQQAYQHQIYQATSVSTPPTSFYPSEGFATPLQAYHNSQQSASPQPCPHHSQTWPQTQQDQQPLYSPTWAQTQHKPQGDPNYFPYHAPPPPPQSITSPVPSVAVSPPATIDMPTPSYNYHQAQQYQSQYPPQQHPQQYSQQHNTNECSYLPPSHPAYQYEPYQAQPQYNAYQQDRPTSLMSTGDTKPPAVSTPVMAELPG